MDSLIDQVVEQLKNLPHEMQMRVYEFTRALAASPLRGVSGQQLMRFAGTIPADELRVMRQVIEQGCERIDNNEW